MLWNKLGRERWVLHVLIHMEAKNVDLIEVETRTMATRVRKVGEKGRYWKIC